MFILYKNKNYNIHKRQILENVILSQNLIFLRILISKFLMKNHIFHAKNLCKNLKINILDLASKKFVGLQETNENINIEKKYDE